MCYTWKTCVFHMFKNERMSVFQLKTHVFHMFTETCIFHVFQETCVFQVENTCFSYVWANMCFLCVAQLPVTTTTVVHSILSQKVRTPHALKQEFWSRYERRPLQNLTLCQSNFVEKIFPLRNNFCPYNMLSTCKTLPQKWPFFSNIYTNFGTFMGSF